MARGIVVPEEMVEQEIERLRKSPAVKLAQKEQRLKADHRRKYLADLRWYEKRGLALIADGWTFETLDLLSQDIPESAEE